MHSLEDSFTMSGSQSLEEGHPCHSASQHTTQPEVEEEGNENITNEIPFNPNDISINIVPRTIGQLVDMLEYDEIIVPRYQRLPNLWSPKKKSRFIESLMLNLPIPLFYFDEGEDKKWRVIDGLQRISTLEHFILGDRKNTIGKNNTPLRLENLEFKTEFNGKTWDELPRETQRRIMTSQVTINLIGKGTPEEVKYNIFSRINQGGVELSAQEIRTALFQGYRVDFLEKLVSPYTECGQAFRRATTGSVSTTRQQDLDFATRFISFYLIGFQQYMPDMDTFLTKGTKSIPTDIPSQNKIFKAFGQAMKLATTIFERDAFRKIMNGKRQPINRSLFEVVSVHFAQLTHSDSELLQSQKGRFIDAFLEMQNEPGFMQSISTATATKERVKKRHTDFLTLLERFGIRIPTQPSPNTQTNHND